MAEDAAADVRETERRRIKALLRRDLDIAREILAEDFELIPPPGVVLSREQYLGAIASGALRYSVWEAISPIAVRSYGDNAVIRYKARIEVESEGRKTAGQYWFTDAYEYRAGRWQIVWSQGTLAP